MDETAKGEEKVRTMRRFHPSYDIPTTDKVTRWDRQEYERILQQPPIGGNPWASDDML